MPYTWYVTFELHRRGTLLRRRSPRATKTFETEREAKDFARAKFNDVKPEDFRQPLVLVAKLDASADISLPEGLLMIPFGIKADSAEAAQMQMAMRQKQIAALAEQGYIQRDGAMIRSRLEFRNGQLTA